MIAKVLIQTLDLNYEQWLEYRKKGIGGSDAAAIAGLSPFKSAISVFIDKTEPKSEPIDSERMRIGRDLEDYVAKRFEEMLGKKVRKRNAILQHPEHEWMLANVDRLVVGESAGLECKVTNSYAKKQWEEGIPPMYELQCHHYMAVTGLDKWYIAALIGNEAVSIHEIKRDEEIINYLINIEKDFYENHILKNEMPAPDGSSDASDLIKMMYPDSDASETVVIDKNEYVDMVNRYDQINELIKTLEKEQELIKQDIQMQMKEAEKAIISDRTVIWKTVESNRLDSKKLKAELPNIYEKYTNKSSSRRFQIK